MKLAEDEGESRSLKEKKGVAEFVSFFDINQLELAFINRALREGGHTLAPDIVKISKKERILRIQKKNLEALLRKKHKETNEGALESELKKILSGVKIFRMF